MGENLVSWIGEFGRSRSEEKTGPPFDAKAGYSTEHGQPWLGWAPRNDNPISTCDLGCIGTIAPWKRTLGLEHSISHGRIIKPSVWGHALISLRCAILKTVMGKERLAPERHGEDGI
ncbi:hypothetical protein IAQ61_006817 [Plenodomus lingam]|uniref:uncharacterized protein n=1 Tax=Leptosphaeria maculans TaxID=5022 RepID=UPI003325D4A2|nr:hypothetical protein IAQ61_006817 [Plenodomus lingam]